MARLRVQAVLVIVARLRVQTTIVYECGSCERPESNCNCGSFQSTMVSASQPARATLCTEGPRDRDPVTPPPPDVMAVTPLDNKNDDY